MGTREDGTLRPAPEANLEAPTMGQRIAASALAEDRLAFETSYGRGAERRRAEEPTFLLFETKTGASPDTYGARNKTAADYATEFEEGFNRPAPTAACTDLEALKRNAVSAETARYLNEL